MIRVIIIIHCQYQRPRILVNHVLDCRADFTFKWDFLVKDFPHQHSEGVDVHLRVRILSFFLSLETLRRRPNVDRPIGIKHVCIPFEVTHLKLTKAHDWLLRRLFKINEYIVRVEASVGERITKWMELVHNFCQLHQYSYFLLQREAFGTVIDPLRLVDHLVERKKFGKDNCDLHFAAHVNAKGH